MKHPLSLAALAILMPVGGLLFAGPPSQDPAHLGKSSIEWPAGLDPAAIEDLTSTLLLDEPGDGRTWARGPRWKASFGNEGLTYIPFFGSNAPKNYPVEFDLVDVRIGGEPLALGERQRSRSGQQVTLGRGSLNEVYHLTKDTVEQTFVFDSLPARQALELDIQVTTELEPSTSPIGGFDYSNGLGSVHYGRAYALDATGQILELVQKATPDGFRITVPRDFVQKAVLPLIVDPTITPYSITNDTRTQTDVDVVYDSNTAVTQIVFSERQSAFDSDVIEIHYNPPIDSIIRTSSIDITSANWTMPRNATNYHEQQFLVGSVVGNIVGSRRVWGRTSQSIDGTRGPQFQISGVGAETVDVGGQGRDASSLYDYMVVWQEADGINQDFDIVAQAVGAGSSTVGSRRIIDGDATDMDRAPTISKSSGYPGAEIGLHEYMIVWEREVATDNRNLRGQVIEYTGSMTGHNQFNVYTFSDSIHADVSSASRSFSFASENYWIVAFERRIGSIYNIFTVVARDGSADNARNIHTMRNLDVDADHRTPVIASGWRDFLLSFQTVAPNGDRHIEFTELNVVHDNGELRTGINGRGSTLAISNQAPAKIAVTSDWDGGAYLPIGATFFPTWIAEDAAGETQVAGAEIYADFGTVNGSQYCEAEINSSGSAGWIRADRSYYNSQSMVYLKGFDLPQNVFGYFLVGSQSGFIMNPGASDGHLCLQGLVGRYNRSDEILFSGNEGAYQLT
ncbi:MAG: hypothetical protein P1V35_14365, partial [Planctomycetota bacterium]|nr:hypothetical protein [Planctomycetota bacterium]